MSNAAPHRDGTGGRPVLQRLHGWRLRTKLLLATLGLLTLTCCTIGFLSHAVMNVFLVQQLDETLLEASDRAVNFPLPPGGTPPSPDDGNLPDPLDVPGQGGPGMLDVRYYGNTAFSNGVTLDDGTRQALSADDVEVLAALPADRVPVSAELSFGEYRLVSQPQPATGSVVVSGMPLAATKNTLLGLGLTIAAVSLLGLALTAVLGYLIIRRSLRPLEEVAAVATSVSRLPLDVGDVALAERVPQNLADSQTEVGSVGLAFNKMLDNVAHALKVRQRSELQIRQFVADASHELRTPLTSIRGYTEMVRLTEHLSPEGTQSLGRVEAESRRMAGLVDDLLLLARLDEGRQEIRSEVDLTRLLVETVSDARIAARDHHWRIELPEEPVTVTGDPGQLRQVFINLVTNAHVHTPPGTTVDVSLVRDGGDAVLRVADTGAGIPADFQERIFSRFARRDTSRSERTGSSGLGLAIVDAIVAAHHGTITLESVPGDTVFTVRLPVRPASEDIVQPGREPDSSTEVQD
ncbi:HAMP domain-containing sensor histidine kinase [Arthrobacter sp. zg-Y820]|uniref:sensor histidine kinase n=1 Tax=unclassified Arthrobacter TaxID=235627 RepID=UPI001E452439|nr:MULTISPECIES: HAMP domain-containing sensor histidine kinase [unclassified Arthrobacter]MCC9197141.1 HAMP domain-containing histidine kinase [Arthrobacter sp. zg-Y820]MDK1280006.1 HAMP domain-containing sensor histidine kinase [Arthrobacter sp. zg.Y820]WIB09303.1 HAMP domain-containing sensor histidine kinase [Arthrobacter sp. zg-Y820]